MTDILSLIQQDPNVSQSFKDALPDSAPIPVTPSPSDFTTRALRAELLLSIVRTTLIKLVTEATENDHTNIMKDADLVRSIDAHLSDLAGDISGALHQVAERLIADNYGSVTTRGPFVRVRR